MNDKVLDTGILVRYLRRSPGYLSMFKELALEGGLHISTITRMEVIRGLREHERKNTFAILNNLISISVDSEIADQAGEWILSWRKSGIALGDADAIIAATAYTLDLPLITTNQRHFPMPELVIWQADEGGNLNPVER